MGAHPVRRTARPGQTHVSAPADDTLFDVVVVACDSGALLIDCLARAMQAEHCASVTLYDNASRDGWPQRVADRYKGDHRFALLSGARNIGFGSACNRGSAVGTAPWIVLLNPDCLVDASALSRMVDIALDHPEIGLLGADVRDALGREEPAARRRDPTPMRLLQDHLPWRRGAAAGVRCAREATALQRVDACSGALMMLPRGVYQQLSGFDESYFLHGEDLDLCARVRALGLQVAVANEVRVEHRQGGSSRARPLFVAWHKHLGLGRFLLRHKVRSLAGRVLVVFGIAAAFLLRGLPRALASGGR